MDSTSLHVVIGAGPLGRAVAEHALQTGDMVRLITRSGKASMPGAESVAADLMDAGAARAACEGAHVVYQCAARPTKTGRRNFQCCRRMFCKGRHARASPISCRQ